MIRVLPKIIKMPTIDLLYFKIFTIILQLSDCNWFCSTGKILIFPKSCVKNRLVLLKKYLNLSFLYCLLIIKGNSRMTKLQKFFPTVFCSFLVFIKEGDFSMKLPKNKEKKNLMTKTHRGNKVFENSYDVLSSKMNCVYASI